MSALVRLHPSGAEFPVEGNDTLLEAALRAGLPLKYGCSNGNCGACLARLISGQITKARPHDYPLSERERANGHFLMCAYSAEGNVVIEAGEQTPDSLPEQQIAARVRSLDKAGNMRILHLVTPRSQRLQYLAGQRVWLQLEGGAKGEYSVASCPCEDRHLEFHIPLGGSPFAREAVERLGKDQVVQVKGPTGRFVFDGNSTRPVLLVAWGAGFAPIKSLAQQVFNLEQNEAVHLVWAAEAGGHYLENLCRSWADALDAFTYTALESEDCVAAAAAVADAIGPVSGWDIYAAGPSSFIEALGKALLSRGITDEYWHFEAYHP